MYCRIGVINYMLNKLKPTVAVIDSGLGGLSVLSQLIKQYKTGNFIYFADNLNMPYGKKSKQFLTKRVGEIIEFLNLRYKPDHILIACNTASSVIENNKYSNVKTISFNNLMPILATPLTASQLAGFDVIADKTLANLVEHHIDNLTYLQKQLKHHIERLKLADYEQIKLGCTHYELIKPLFEKLCPKTKFHNNSDCLLEKLNFAPKNDNLTVKILISKKSECYENKINSVLTKLINEKF